MTELADKLTTLIKDKLAESQVNKDNESAEYRLGKNEAYSKMFVHFKTEAGGIYCVHPDTKDCWEEYLYEISNGVVDGEEAIFITIYEKPPRGYDGWVEIFNGTPEELLTKIEEYVED